MNLYRQCILPRCIDWSCGSEQIEGQRRKVVPLAGGKVLEVGVGSGHNLPLYDPAKVERIYGLDPAPEL